VKKKATKSVVKNETAKIIDEQERAILAFVNASTQVVRSVLEVGSAMASDCHEVDDLARKIAEKYNFKKGNYWEDYKR
jgi:hypothetical protein